MAFKFVAIFALLAVVNAGIVPVTQVYHGAPAAQVYHAAPATQIYHAAPAAQVYHADPASQVYHAAPASQVYHAAPATQVYHAAPAAVVNSQPILTKAAEEYDPHPQYKFGYDVQDTVSGDSKRQVEERDGDVVRGEYSLVDADGYKRTVQYTADPINGFNAVVNREPLAVKTVVKTISPVAHYATPAHYAAPSVIKTVAPVAHYAAPAYATYSAPALVKSVAPAYTTYAAPATYVAHHH